MMAHTTSWFLEQRRSSENEATAFFSEQNTAVCAGEVPFNGDEAELKAAVAAVCNELAELIVRNGAHTQLMKSIN